MTPLSPARLGSSGEFLQRGRSLFVGRGGDPARPVWHDKYEGFASFPSIRENIGVLDTLPALKHPLRALPAGHPRYRGEVFFASEQGRVEGYSFTPNRWKVHARGPGTLVLNQNFHPGWQVLRGEEAPYRSTAPDGCSMVSSLLACRLSYGSVDAGR